MKFKSNFKVIAPATIANLGCGLDALGLALESPGDEVFVKPSNKTGIHISSILNNKTKIPLETDKNAAGVSAKLVLEHLKTNFDLDPKAGLDLGLNKKVAVGHGLGSSTASAVAGAFAVNEAFGCHLTKRDLIPFIMKGEELAKGQLRVNSLLPSLLGGIILTRDHQALDFHRLPLVKGLQMVVIYAQKQVLDKTQLRNNLTSKTDVANAIQQSANLGAFVQALYTSNLDLLSSTLTDHIAEKHWSALIPFFKELKATALNNGALGCGLAGAGPGVFALCKNSLEAEKVAKAMELIYTSNNIENTVIRSKIDHEGVRLA
ncbi:MAG: Homoserine kinase [uncultured Aureispira sp.]|uniref:Homoserine kinase n=1 Tax=uncultured Aureispira sp. TaxID=1331704 RepID=A0A6S6SHH7_9BACT|nr:MAG: Homoserine kinase [uncultured Aureispira sp.]